MLEFRVLLLRQEVLPAEESMEELLGVEAKSAIGGAIFGAGTDIFELCKADRPL